LTFNGSTLGLNGLLEFPSTAGNKVTLYTSSGVMGLGVFSGEFRNSADSSGTAITWGYYTGSTFTERMRLVNSSGNVGIGLTPSHTLDVNGVIRGSRNIVFVATGTYNMTATWNSLSATAYTDLISVAYTPKQTGTVTLLVEATFETYQTSRQGDDGIRFRIVNAAATELSAAQYYTELGTSNMSSLSWFSPLRYTGTVSGADTFKLQYQCFNGGVYNTRRGVLTIYEISSTA